MPHTARRTLLATTIALAASLTLASCSTPSSAHNTTHTNSSSSSSGVKETPPALTTNATNPNQPLQPHQPVTVTTTKGDLTVTMTNTSTGDNIKGTIKGNTWTSDTNLPYGTTYTLDARAGSGHKTWTITIPKPITAEPTILAIKGSTVGVGQTVAVRFDAHVANRKAAEDSIHITTDPKVEGKFHWVTPREVRWRPEKFWQPGTHVSIDVDIYGKDLGDDVWGGQNTSSNFTIGDSVTAVADDATHTMTVSKNGEVVKTIPISMGSDEHPTPNGTYFLGDHNRKMIMDSSTYGVPATAAEGYKLEVDNATQVSYSGVYVHSAPWALQALGQYNQSHGCINVSPEDADWFLNNTKRGDVLVVKNTTGGVVNGDEGLADWSIPWDEW